MSRRVATRNPKNNILIFVEGTSEKRYLEHFKSRGANLEISITESKRKDPMHMVKLCAKDMNEKGIFVKNGDCAYCVIDVDRNTRGQMEKASMEADKKGIKMIVSNPCLETWFLMHFRDAPEHVITHEEIYSELQNFLGCPYEKGGDIWNEICKHIDRAIRLSRHISERHSLSSPLDFFDKNYSTSMHELINDIEKMKERNSR